MVVGPLIRRPEGSQVDALRSSVTIQSENCDSNDVRCELRGMRAMVVVVPSPRWKQTEPPQTKPCPEDEEFVQCSGEERRTGFQVPFLCQPVDSRISTRSRDHMVRDGSVTVARPRCAVYRFYIPKNVLLPWTSLETSMLWYSLCTLLLFSRSGMREIASGLSF